MSFSSDVKQELLQVRPEKACCQLSELSALTQSCASMRLAGGGRIRIVYAMDSLPLARRLFSLLKKRLNIVPQIEYVHLSRLGGQRQCLMTVNEKDSKALLIALRLMHETEQSTVYRGVPRAVMTRRCCRSAFVRCTYLGSGAMSSPEKGYHMEFNVSEKQAELLRHILDKSGIRSGILPRRGQYMVYLKKGDDVSACLALMGANNSVINMENMRVIRESRNAANRAANCDNANLKKQLTAASEQNALIEAYYEKHGWDGVPPELVEAGSLRLAHPEASLDELGAMTEKKLSKSGIDHRLRRLTALIAEKDQEE